MGWFDEMFEDYFDPFNIYEDTIKPALNPVSPREPDPKPREVTQQPTTNEVARGKRRAVLLPRDLGELKLSQPFLLGRRGT